MRAAILGLVFLCLIAVAMAKGKHHCKKEKHKGCRLFHGHCRCEQVNACHNPFPYNTEKECLDDAKGLNDQCAGSPCKNGVCVQVKHGNTRGWYCECAGTGFYGNQCQNRCPPGKDPIPENYPIACVMTDEIFKEYH